MSKSKSSTIEVKGTAVAVLAQNQQDYICITDIARHKDAERTDYLISNWLRNRNTIEFLGVWEQLNNPGFHPIEFDGIRKQAGLNSFILTAKRWIDSTGAIGLLSKSGRYGGTYAHKDIAFEFASWVSVEFKLNLIKEFQRLKDEENDRLQLGWNLQRTLAKINYRIHTDAIKETLLPPSPRPRRRSSTPTKPTCSTSPSSARPRNSGATPIPTPTATSAITPRWSSSSSSPISKASTLSSSARACPSPSACSS
jgi:hypothetical protein